MGRHLLPMPFGGDLVSYKNARARRAANAEETNLFTMRRHCLLALLSPFFGILASPLHDRSCGAFGACCRAVAEKVT
ncbi:hypothetical protein SAMN05444141_10467 [Pseudovibrio denitrificans]|uniref:Uncharacterized protein n=1 Tax=Pseudovibrio denitrificans TaxID=258256 RepID=A0A1I7BL81_9HYPH|nr:hypothetical protein SAMN05444141_10467 [Pseudovibrio denitrificans]